MPSNGRRTLALWLHVAAISAAPVAIGGVHTVTAAVLLVPTLLALAIQLRWRLRERVGYTPPAFAWVLLALAAVVALQLVPLPAAVLRALSPEAAALRGEAAALAGVEPGWAPLSLSPPATARDLLRVLAALGTFLGVAGLVRLRPGAGTSVLTAVVATAVALVAVAVIQQVFGSEAILGLYEPQTTGGHRFFWSTFVNQNHFAAFLCLAAPLALGLALDPATPRSRALPLVGAFAAVALGAVLTLSRSGALVLGGEIALFGLLWLLARRRPAADPREPERREPAVGWGAVAAALFVAGAVALFVALPRLTAEWRAIGSAAELAEYPKWATLPDAWRLIQAFPWTGVGAGAYGEVFPAFNAALPDATFHYVENGVVQLAADVGLPAAGALLAAALPLLVLLLVRSLRRPLLIGAAVAVVGVAVENLADFSLALPGVALPAAAALGVLAGKTRGRRRRAAADSGAELALEGGRTRSRVALAGVALALAGAVPAAVLALTQPLGQVRDAVAAGAPDALAVAARCHPADPVVALAAGQRALLGGDRAAAGAWFARARRLSPYGLWPALHTLRLALADGDAEAARGALRTIFTAHPGHAADRRRVLELLRGRPDVAALLGPAVDWDPALLVAAVADLRRMGGELTAERLLRAALAHHPDDAPLLHALAELYLGAGQTDAADGVATRLMALHPQRPEGYLVLGELALARGDAALAEHLFREAARLAPADRRALFRRAEALTRLGDWGKLESVFRDLADRATAPRERAELLFLRSRAAEARGELKVALSFAREAVHELPRHVPYLRQLARLLEALERPESALPVYGRILELSPNDRPATAAITRLRDAGSEAEALRATTPDGALLDEP